MLDYVKPGEPFVQGVPVRYRSPLWSLAQVSQMLATETGFSSWSVVAYILVDIRPLLPPTRTGHVDSWDSQGNLRQYATLAINPPGPE